MQLIVTSLMDLIKYILKNEKEKEREKGYYLIGGIWS